MFPSLRSWELVTHSTVAPTGTGTSGENLGPPVRSMAVVESASASGHSVLAFTLPRQKPPSGDRNQINADAITIYDANDKRLRIAGAPKGQRELGYRNAVTSRHRASVRSPIPTRRETCPI